MTTYRVLSGNYPTPFNRVCFENLLAAQLVKNFSPLTEPEVPSLNLQMAPVLSQINPYLYCLFETLCYKPEGQGPIPDEFFEFFSRPKQPLYGPVVVPGVFLVEVNCVRHRKCGASTPENPMGFHDLLQSLASLSIFTWISQLGSSLQAFQPKVVCICLLTCNEFVGTPKEAPWRP